MGGQEVGPFWSHFYKLNVGGQKVGPFWPHFYNAWVTICEPRVVVVRLGHPALRLLIWHALLRQSPAHTNAIPWQPHPWAARKESFGNLRGQHLAHSSLGLPHKKFLYNPKAFHWQTIGSPLAVPIYRRSQGKANGTQKAILCNPKAIPRRFGNRSAFPRPSVDNTSTTLT